MAYDARTGEFVRELLAGLGEVRIRPMFGGAGVYFDDLFFAIIDDDVLYLRAEEDDRPAYQAAGARQFTYAMKDGVIQSMAYWSLPDSAADDPEEAVAWARKAVEAARRKAVGKRKPKGR
jgi:DNA transformation protein and related proteins